MKTKGGGKIVVSAIKESVSNPAAWINSGETLLQYGNVLCSKGLGKNQDKFST